MSRPRVTLRTTVRDPATALDEQTIASVVAQSCPAWEWLITDGSRDPAVGERLRRLAAGEPRILVEDDDDRDDQDRARGDFVAWLGAEDVLEPRALQVMLDAAELDPTADFLYSDHDVIGPAGEVLDVHRKPRWSPERLRHHFYTADLSLVRRRLLLQVVEQVGGPVAGRGDPPSHDLVLRVGERARSVAHVPEVLYHRRAVGGSLEAGAEAWDASVRAVRAHLGRVGIRAEVARGRAAGLVDIRREPDLTTPVSIVIPTRGSRATVWGSERDLVVETVRSIRRHSEHRSLEFVVVHDLDTPDRVLEDLREIADVDLVLVPFAAPFNFSAKCNLGAVHARHDVLLFLNDDMEASSAGVVEQLIAPLAEPGVGMTGAKLLFEDQRVQHAGVSYGSGRVAHSYYGARPGDAGHCGELVIDREVSVLTGACVALAREVFDAAGGFCELLPVSYNDVDLCLKVRSLGHRLLWLHDTVLFHFESMSRSPTVHAWENDFIARRWGDRHLVREQFSTEPV